MNVLPLAPEVFPWIAALGIAAAILVLGLTIRGIWNRMSRTKPPSEGELRIDESAVTRPRDFAERADRAFDKMIERSSLGITSAEATSWMLLVGVLVGGSLFLWRESLPLAGLGATVVMAGVFLVFYVSHSLWRRKLQNQLPDAFFFMARSLRAGLSLEQAIEMSGKQGEEPLAKEFRRTTDQLKLGAPLATALQLTADRLRLLDFNIFSSMVTLHREVGGNLALVLDRLATSTRDRNLFRGHVRAATALGRISGLFVAAAAPLLLLGYWSWQPEYLQTFVSQPVGLAALAVAGILEVVGIIWLVSLFRVEY